VDCTRLFQLQSPSTSLFYEYISNNKKAGSTARFFIADTWARFNFEVIKQTTTVLILLPLKRLF